MRKDLQIESMQVRVIKVMWGTSECKLAGSAYLSSWAENTYFFCMKQYQSFFFYLKKGGRKIHAYQRNVSSVAIYSYHLWAFSDFSCKFYINICIFKFHLNKEEF